MNIIITLFVIWNREREREREGRDSEHRRSVQEDETATEERGNGLFRQVKEILVEIE